MKKILFFMLACVMLCGMNSCTQPAQQATSADTAANAVRLTRNATLKVNYAGKTFLLDPMLSEKEAVKISALGINMNPRVHLTMPVEEILDSLDFVLLTHSHIDHYDDAAKRLISKDMQWYVQPADYDTVAVKDKFVNTKIIEDSIKIDDLTIIRVQGSHGRGKLAEMMGISSGYVLKAEGQPTLYIMGDCVWDESTKKAVATYAPDYIVVNSGGAGFVGLSKEFGPIIPDEKEVMQMLKEIPASTKMIAVHMDAVDHCQTTRAILRNEANYNHIDSNRLMIPEDGETIRF